MRKFDLSSAVVLRFLLGLTHSQAQDCELATFIAYQPVEYICSGTTARSRTSSTYVDCEPSTCVSAAQRPLCDGGIGCDTETSCCSDCTTTTTTGPIAGTTTLPCISGRTTTTVLTETTKGPATIMTTGPVPGTTALPAPTDSTIVIVTVTTDQATSSSSDMITVPDPTSPPGPDPVPSKTTTSPAPDSSSSMATTSEATPLPSSSTTMSSSSTSSASTTCSDLPNGDFGDGTMPPWYISDQVTADSSNVLAQGLDDHPYAFALIPSQASFAQVYLNNYLPSCGDPPPVVTLTIRFMYQFTGDSTGCTIGVSTNRDPSNLVDIVDDGSQPGVWQSYEGTPVEVQLTYDPLFTVKLACQENTPNVPAILVTAISAY